MGEQPKAVAVYLRTRADTTAQSHYGDDRESSRKMWADAELRGSIGCAAANRLIDAIDYTKSWR
jgi:hypothetical protein